MTPTTRPTMDELLRSLDNLLNSYWYDEDFDDCNPETMEDFDTPEQMLSYVSKKINELAAMSRTTHAGEGMVEDDLRVKALEFANSEFNWERNVHGSRYLCFSPEDLADFVVSFTAALYGQKD